LVCLHTIRLIWKHIQRPHMADVKLRWWEKALTICTEMYI